MASLGRLAGLATPTIDTFIHLAEVVTGIPYRQVGLTLEKMGLAGREPTDLARFLFEGHDDE